MQWGLLYLSIRHDRCYWEHVAQYGVPSCMYHIRALTASGTASIWEEISVVVACKPMWQNIRAYQSPTLPVSTLMLNCCWCLRTILSVITHKLNVTGHMLIWTSFLVLVFGTRGQSLSASFNYTLYIVELSDTRWIAKDFKERGRSQIEVLFRDMGEVRKTPINNSQDIRCTNQESN
jgi:hypothetical protein